MPYPCSAARSEIVFVFDDLPEWNVLANAAPRGAEVVVLSGAEDGLAQIAAHLLGRAGVDALHILSHGQPGSLQLGSLTLDQAALEDRADVLAQIGGALSEQGDILLYGCDVAAHGAGEAFVQALAEATGADVAASNDLTGSSATGGDWALEFHHGGVDTKSLSGLADYGGLLAAPTTQNFDGVTLGDENGTLSKGTPGAPRIIDGWTFTLLNSAGTQDVSEHAYVDVTNKTDWTSLANDGSDKAAYLNGPQVLQSTGNAAAVFKATSGDEFSFVSIRVETGASTGNDYRVVGYLDGSTVTGANHDFISGAFGGGGTLVTVSGAAWQYVDEVRIVRQGGHTDISIYVDDIVVAPAIVPAAPPVITSVNSTANGAYKVGSEISIQVNFSANVIVTGAPQLTLETGANVQVASYASGTGTSTLTFSYTVQEGDTTADLDYASTAALGLNSGTIMDSAGNTAILTLPTPGASGSLGDNKNIVIDTTAPQVVSVSVPADGTYGVPQHLDFTVNFNEAVTVNATGGTPHIELTLDTGGTAFASYSSGSGSSALVFRYTVAVGVQSTNGVAVGALSANSGTLRDAAGNDAALTLHSVGASTNVRVDGIAPDVPDALALHADSDTGASNSDHITNDTTPTVTGKAEANSTVTLFNGLTSLGTATTDGDGNWSVTSSTLSAGTYTLTAKATDVAGNVSGASDGLTLTIDTVAPALQITSSATALKAEETAVITFTFNEDPGSSFTWDGSVGDVNVTGGALGAISGAGLTRTASFTPAADTNSGSATITVNASSYTDAAGNGGTAASPTPTITFDTLAPTAPLAPDLDAASDSGASSTDNVTSDSTPTVTGTAEANSTVTLFNGVSTLGTATADGVGNWTYTTGNLADGTYTLTAKATDGAGNVSDASSSLQLTIDTTVPVFASATVNGNQLVLTYTEATTLDAVNAPAAGDFSVEVDLTPNAVTGVVINATSKTVTLTLTTAASAGQAVTVAYTDSSVGVSAIQDAAGNDASTLAATAVTNTTPVPDSSPPSTPVDGVPVVTTPGAGGTTIITIPVFTPTRPDDASSPNGNLADIPLVKGTDGHPIVQVSVPVGVGLQAQGLPGPVIGNAAVAELGQRLGQAAAGDAQLASDSQAFLASLDPSEPLTVQTITATPGAGFNPGVPFVISGSTAAGDGKQAIILDVSALPSGTLIQVDNIDFIAVVGAVRIIGGEGQNIASGDGASQWIVLGADDDVIHGGGGDDVVASKGGNDRLFGDDGNDTVVGGIGDDHLEGGAGHDVLQGGMSDAGAWSFSLNADGTLQVAYSASEKLLTDVQAASTPGTWSGDEMLDARIALVYQDYGQLETISLLFKGLTGELPTLQAMNTFATQGWSHTDLLQAAWQWFEGALPANASTQDKVQALIGQAWGQAQATPESIQIGLDYLAQGGTWAGGLQYLVSHANVRGLVTTAEGRLNLTQAAAVGEAGWGADSGADTLMGGAGNDVLIGGGGNDILDGGEGTDMAVFVGAVQHFSVQLRDSTASGAVAGQQEIVLRYDATGETDILRDVELLQIGGQTYWLQAEGLQSGAPYQALATHVQVVTPQELVLVGLPAF